MNWFKKKFDKWNILPCQICGDEQNREGLCITCFYIDDIDFDSHERNTFSKEINILLNNLKNYINEKKYGDWINEWHTCFITNNGEFRHLKEKAVIAISNIRGKLGVKNLKQKLKKEKEEKEIVEKWLN